MIRRGPWLRFDPTTWDDWCSKSRLSYTSFRFFICDHALRSFFDLPRATSRLRIVTSDQRPDDEHFVFLESASGYFSIAINGRTFTLGMAFKNWLDHHFQTWSELYAWVEVELA